MSERRVSERRWIDAYIRPLVRAEGADQLRDDVAILSGDHPLIATMDTLVESVHFFRGDKPRTVGRKLVRQNVSDIFAKGALPVEALVSIAWPFDRIELDFRFLMEGLGEDLGHFSIDLVGGDLVRTEGPAVLTMTLTGRCLADGPVRRDGRAQAGDTVWVSGEIGWGGLGLAAVKEKRNPVWADRYRVPTLPPQRIVEQVAQHARASMDVSDGLLIDAQALAEANDQGIRIDLDRVPLALPGPLMDSLLYQVTAGDDYQILIIVPAGSDPGEGFTRIGDVTDTPGLSLNYHGEPVNLPVTLGFEH